MMPFVRSMTLRDLTMCRPHIFLVSYNTSGNSIDLKEKEGEKHIIIADITERDVLV
jgi:hypothetical protein